MADSVRVVTFQTGGQITEVAALQSSLDWTVNSSGFTKNSLAILRGERNQQMVSRGGRYDGESFGGEKVSNSTYKFQVLVGGPTPDALIAKMNALYTVTERIPGPLYIEHKDDGATYPTYYEIRAPAKAQENRDWAQRMGAGSVAIDVEWPIAPLGCGAPMDVTDTAVASNLTDYTFDAMTAGTFEPTASLTSERRIIHTVRGYKQGSCQVTASAAPGSTITGYKLGAIPKRTAPDAYLDCYVDDDGVNSRLRIDVVLAGAHTNRFTTNLGARVSNGTTFWVRGRIEDGVVYVEYFTSVPTPMATPTSSGSYTLLTTDLAALGVNVQGQGGYDWIPQHASATVPTVEILPYTYRNKTMPATWTLDGPIPGTTSALCEIQAMPNALGTSPLYPPKFAMFGWTGRTGAAAPQPFGIYEAEAASLSSGFSAQADASKRGGSYAHGSGGAMTAAIAIDFASLFPDDDLADCQAVEVWARVQANNAASSIKAHFIYGGGAEDVTPLEFGSTALSVPGTGVTYLMRLGTFIIERPRDLTTGTLVITQAKLGGTGTVGFDYVAINPASRRALTPTGKSSAPAFVASYPPAKLRTITSNLGGFSSLGVGRGSRAPGLAGSQIKFPTGTVDVICQFSAGHVGQPGDTIGDTAMLGTFFSATVHYGIVPCYVNQRAE